jgi:hypothetical protein
MAISSYAQQRRYTPHFITRTSNCNLFSVFSVNKAISKRIKIHHCGSSAFPLSLNS